MLRIFFDTEYTQLPQGELLALGAVSENGVEFYAEVYPVLVEMCSEFVKKQVLPRFTGPAYTLPVLQERFWQWLGAFEQQIVLIHDSVQDREHIINMFGSSTITLAKGYTAICDMCLTSAHTTMSSHALRDAWDLRNKYFQAVARGIVR